MLDFENPFGTTVRKAHMLSQKTTTILKELADVSDKAYDQGGLYYKYHMGYRLAHCLLKDDLRAAFFDASNTTYASLPDENVISLGVFIENALGSCAATKASDNAMKAAKTLIEQLKKDLMPDLICLEVANNGLEGNAIFYMARRSDNTFFSLAMSWSTE